MYNIVGEGNSANHILEFSFQLLDHFFHEIHGRNIESEFCTTLAQAAFQELFFYLLIGGLCGWLDVIQKIIELLLQTFFGSVLRRDQLQAGELLIHAGPLFFVASLRH